MTTKAYREGWERTFAPKPKLVTCPFPLRRGLVINVELPRDLKLADLPRFVAYLATMSDDWDPAMGFPVLTWPELEAERAAARDVARLLPRPS